MVNVNVLYNETTGRILSASVDPISPVPAGHAVVVKDLQSVLDLADRRLSIPLLTILPKDFIQAEGESALPVASVETVAFTKRDGSTKALMDDVGDDEALLVSVRNQDFSYTPEAARAFFDDTSIAFESGAAQVKMATGLASGKEMLCVWNDDLRPLFKVYDYV